MTIRALALIALVLASTPAFAAPTVGDPTLPPGTDQTPAVQAALNALGPMGGIVEVPLGVDFYLVKIIDTQGVTHQGLSFPSRSNLRYWLNSDLSNYTYFGRPRTNELMMFAANSNCAGGTGNCNPGEGAVDENWFSSPFGTGSVLGVRCDVPFPYLGSDQSPNAPCRTQFVINENGLDSFRIVHENYQTGYSIFSGNTMQGFYNAFVLSGVTSSDWGATPPKPNDILIGAISQARGYFVSADTNGTTILALSGIFRRGEHLMLGSQSSAHTVTNLGSAAGSFPPFGQDLVHGAWSIACPVGAVQDPFAVCGQMTIQRGRATGWINNPTTLAPCYNVIDSYENATPAGLGLCSDTTASPTARRLTVRAYGGSTDLADVGGMRLHTEFGDSAVPAVNSFNVASINRNGNGAYTINVPTGVFVAADQQCTLGKTNPADNPVIAARTTGTVVVQNYTNGPTPTAQALQGSVDVICTGGDRH